MQTVRIRGGALLLWAVSCLVGASACSHREAVAQSAEARAATATAAGPATLSFSGARSVLAGENWLRLDWRAPGEAPMAYRVYTSTTTDDPRRMTPALELRGDVTEATLRPLPTGTTVHVMVRAVDAGGREDSNRVVLRGTPNPVRFVDGSAAESGSGDTPQSPYRTLVEVLEETLGTAGINVFLTNAALHERVLLFDGMALYGGFPPGFELSGRDAGRAPTPIATESEGDLVVIAPGKRWCILDGLALQGNARSSRGIVGDDCRVQLCDVRIQGFRRMGLHLRGDEDHFSILRARLLRCQILGNQGEGLVTRGITDLHLTECDISQNGQEGIECKPLAPGNGRAGQLWMEGCRVVGNGDAGVDVKLNLLEGPAERWGPVRVGLWDNLVEENDGTGINVDVQFSANADVELAVDLRRNLVQRQSADGIHLDVDSAGRFGLLNNRALDNGGAGLRIKGDDDRAVVVSWGNEVARSKEVGLHLEAAGIALFRDDRLHDNAKNLAAFPGSRALAAGCEPALDFAPFQAATTSEEPMPGSPLLDPLPDVPAWEAWPFPPRAEGSGNSRIPAVVAAAFLARAPQGGTAWLPAATSGPLLAGERHEFTVRAPRGGLTGGGVLGASPRPFPVHVEVRNQSNVLARATLAPTDHEVALPTVLFPQDDVLVQVFTDTDEGAVSSYFLILFEGVP